MLKTFQVLRYSLPAWDLPIDETDIYGVLLFLPDACLSCFLSSPLPLATAVLSVCFIPASCVLVADS